MKKDIELITDLEEAKRLLSEFNEIVKRQDEIIKQLDIKNLSCESVIKEAREYIENPSHEMSVHTYQELLEILKGEHEQ